MPINGQEINLSNLILVSFPSTEVYAKTVLYESL